MTGDVGNLVLQRKPLRFHNAQHRHRNSHQRGLGIGGERQDIFRAFEHGGRELFAQCRVHFLENSARLRKLLCQSLAHTDRLTALPRKSECYRHESLFHFCN